MFMNLHALPPGKEYYTVYVSTQDEDVTREDCVADEVDVIADRVSNTSEWGRVLNDGRVVGETEPNKPATNTIIEMYGEDAMIVGVVSQTEGWIVFDAWRDKERL